MAVVVPTLISSQLLNYRMSNIDVWHNLAGMSLKLIFEF